MISRAAAIGRGSVRSADSGIATRSTISTERNLMKSTVICVAIAMGATAFAAAADDTATTSRTTGNDPMIHTSDDEAAIRALEDNFAAAFNAGDVDAMMKNYVSDKSLVVFDVVPPRQHLGADEYRKAWVGFFAHFKATPKIAITDLAIT